MQPQLTTVEKLTQFVNQLPRINKDDYDDSQILEQWYKNQNTPTKIMVSKAFRQILKNVHTSF